MHVLVGMMLYRNGDLLKQDITAYEMQCLFIEAFKYIKMLKLRRKIKTEEKENFIAVRFVWGTNN